MTNGHFVDPRRLSRHVVRAGGAGTTGRAWLVWLDLDGNGVVDFGDILVVLAAWDNKGGPEDLDGSGFVDFGDLLIVLAAWGPCEEAVLSPSIPERRKRLEPGFRRGACYPRGRRARWWSRTRVKWGMSGQ